MGYFEIQEDVEFGHPIEIYPELPDPEVSFLSGELLSLDLKSPLRFGLECPSSEHPGHFFPGVIPVVSVEFVEMLRAAGIDNFQTFPATLVGNDGTEWKGYVAFNAIGVVDSLDLDRSEGSEIMPGTDDGMPPMCDFPHPVVDPEKASGFRMFREARMRRLLVFDDRLEEFLDDHRPPEGWGVLLNPLDEPVDPDEFEDDDEDDND